MNPDGTNAEIIGSNYRNSYEQSVTSLGDVFQNDNDDPPACRVELGDGIRQLRLLVERRPADLAGGPPAGQTIPVAEWRQDDPGMTPAGDVYGGGSPTGNVFYENGALGPSWEGHRSSRPSRAGTRIFSYQPVRRVRLQLSTGRSS
jgi:hypothetical protein